MSTLAGESNGLSRLVAAISISIFLLSFPARRSAELNQSVVNRAFNQS